VTRWRRTGARAGLPPAQPEDWDCAELRAQPPLALDAGQCFVRSSAGTLPPSSVDQIVAILEPLFSAGGRPYTGDCRSAKSAVLGCPKPSQ
jgi:hypothetical protein